MTDDTISRAAALSALNGCTEIYLNNLPPTIYKTDAVEAVKALPPAQPRWIPCSSALPKTEEKVLITCEYLDIYGKPHRYVCKEFHVDRYTMISDKDW